MPFGIFMSFGVSFNGMVESHRNGSFFIRRWTRDEQWDNFRENDSVGIQENTDTSQ